MFLAFCEWTIIAHQQKDGRVRGNCGPIERIAFSTAEADERIQLTIDLAEQGLTIELVVEGQFRIAQLLEQRCANLAIEINPRGDALLLKIFQLLI